MKWIVAALVIWAVWFLLRKPAAKHRALRDRAEARAVLGVAEDADADAIRAAHRRLIAGVHPDRGGSADLTRRINAARDLLLGRRT
ncbi:DnaJ domain-containing protein [Sphingomonas lenta]|uniref:Molecular chaperone DnaJ n=1 Tax=Sphingomonas lenta TaxID=1141887 RepID=A0A2A2SEI3_9SPHN|nr:DnaJ domain-containing protein [Sphingomonas lenta]PAX07623.1 molecular chaperone DnaJ [Sphingomonas lenta]